MCHLPAIQSFIFCCIAIICFTFTVQAAPASSPTVSARASVATQPPKATEGCVYKAIRFDGPSTIEQGSKSNEKSVEKPLDVKDFHLPPEIQLPLDPGLLSVSKFFSEQTQDIHRAKGYGEDLTIPTGSPARFEAVISLAQNLSSFADTHDFTYWLAHGTLLGQMWNEKMLSIDNDLDIQTTFASLHAMLPHHNQTFNGRYTLLINPWFVHRASRNVQRNQYDRHAIDWTNNQRTMIQYTRESNVIDARFVDMHTGVFADITVLSAEEADDIFVDREWARERATDKQRVHDKSVHAYDFKAISPLRSCEFEGRSMWCPNKKEDVLVQEYPGAKDPHYHEFRYSYAEKKFKKLECAKLAEMYTNPTKDNCDAACREIVKHERVITWDPKAAKNECLMTIRYLDLEEKSSSKSKPIQYRAVLNGQDLPDLPTVKQD